MSLELQHFTVRKESPGHRSALHTEGLCPTDLLKLLIGLHVMLHGALVVK